MGEKEAGKSLVALPLNYTVVDTETTGLSAGGSQLIEVSALRVRNGEVVETFSSLVRPDLQEAVWKGEWQECYVDDFITGLTGITNEMLEIAPFPQEVLPNYFGFLGEDILLGHNTPFDIGFLQAASEKYLEKSFLNDYLDTLRFSRKLMPQLPHHRLSDLAMAFGVSYEGAHRSEVDCRITHACYLALRDLALSRFTEEEFIRLYPRKNFREMAKDIKTEKREFDTSHPLYQKKVVIVGELKAMKRGDAMRKVAEVGGVNQDQVNSRTDYLVVPAGGPVLRGKKIAILSETAFLDMLG